MRPLPSGAPIHPDGEQPPPAPDGEPSSAPRFVDQFDPDVALGGPASKVAVTTTVFDRDPKVRRAVLARAAGYCELCKRQGFETVSGALYLETHHVMPLSDGGRDDVANVVALCPEDHRRAHFSHQRDEIRHQLSLYLTERRWEHG